MLCGTRSPIVAGDVTELKSLRTIAENTRVVCTTVGPYTTYRTPLAEACIVAGTDYCDLNWKINWVREMIDRDHDDAFVFYRNVHQAGPIRVSERCPTRFSWCEP